MKYLKLIKQSRGEGIPCWRSRLSEALLQTKIDRRSNRKLSYKFFGSFMVLACVGKVAYELDLPPSHVSQLKLHVPSRMPVISKLVLQPEASIKQLHPMAILDHRLLLQGTSAQPQVLMQWNALPRYVRHGSQLAGCMSSFQRRQLGNKLELKEEGHVTRLSRG
jgi:hypothetical protein